MIKIGLTGSIGMGKSTVAKMFSERGIQVHDSDQVVHNLYQGDHGGIAVEALREFFPSAYNDGQIDRRILSFLLMDDPSGFEIIEKIMHPLVGIDRLMFFKRCENNEYDFAVADVPLLFETAIEGEFDYTIVVSAPASVQRTRVMARLGMTDEKFDAILAKQWPDDWKRANADFVLDTSGTHDETRQKLNAYLDDFVPKT